ncbi:hypothetical protein [Bradyrhizobium sp. Ce-3]|uniref:hypothetical protein n=1 Tax=Bradyrhizobium sp. Ce-3 TaxID=2913970 RepID=UPI001FC8C92F|nr:hypothetical protein [Bradyrhizobium sp. Ce-3]GKQ52375.1 hypothetical protein BRSPCE3_32300 [Bradyrhizobium sp. Ce-3]
MAFFGLLYLLIFLRGAIIYALTLIPIIIGLWLLRRGKAGWALIVLGLVTPGYFAGQWMTARSLASTRAADIASWPRAKPSANDHPRVLIIQSSRQEVEPFAYFLAETGLFEIYAVLGPRYDAANLKKWRIEVAARDDCRKRRTERDEMVVLTGWRSCAIAVPADKVPSDGLVFYPDPFTAPHSWITTHRDFNTPVTWTLELALHQGSDERVVAYNEFIGFPEMHFHWVVGPVMRPREPPRYRAVAGSQIAAPEPGQFVLKALGIDEHTIVPPQALSIEDQRMLADQLSASGQPDDTQRAVELIAAAPLDQGLWATMRRLAADPATSVQMQLRRQVRWCEKVERLTRYRNVLAEACAANSVPADTCGLVGHPAGWMNYCADDTRPVWRRGDPPARRVFIADVLDGQETPVLLPRAATAHEIRIPGDRGPLDIVIRNQNPSIFVFTGAAPCIARLTVVSNDPRGVPGVVGVDPSRIRFIAPVGSGSWINPAAPYSGDFATLLGIKPDVTLVHHRGGDIDLAMFLAPDGAATPCALDGLQSGGRLKLDTSQIVTMPTIVPFVRTGTATR